MVLNSGDDFCVRKRGHPCTYPSREYTVSLVRLREGLAFFIPICCVKKSYNSGLYDIFVDGVYLYIVVGDKQMVVKGDFIQLSSGIFGEVVGLTPTGYEVYTLEDAGDYIFKYSDEWIDVPFSGAVRLIETRGNILRALQEMNLRPLTENTFTPLNAPVTHIGDFEDLDPDDYDGVQGIHPEMQDFIVPDEEGEAFTFATGPFARETHRAVNNFNRWEPEDPRIKEFIERMDDRIIPQESARTRLGEGLPYLRPPIHV